MWERIAHFIEHAGHNFAHAFEHTWPLLPFIFIIYAIIHLISILITFIYFIFFGGEKVLGRVSMQPPVTPLWLEVEVSPVLFEI